MGIATPDPRAGPRITLQPEGQGERVLADIVGAMERWEMVLPGERPWPIARVAFAALARSESSSPADGILMIRTVIEALLPACATARGEEAGQAGPSHSNVYMTDAMRADHLGCNRYDRPTSPEIDAFAAEALLFENAIAQAPWTTSSVSSMLTGVYPSTHHVTLPQHALPPSLATMGEILRDAGFMTAAFITNGAAGKAFGLARGFTEHRLLRVSVDRRTVRELSDRVNEEVFSRLDTREDDGRSLFLDVHTTDTRSPYTPPPAYARRFLDIDDQGDPDMPDGMPLTAVPDDPRPRPAIDRLIGLYDAEIAFNDRNFGQFLAGLRDRGLLDASLIIFLSDHGEEFYEHGGWQHMKALYADSVRIPCIVKLPGARASRLGRTGINVVDGDWKMIQIRLRDRPDPPPELYDLARDPKERIDVAADSPVVVGYLRNGLRIHESGGSGPEAGESEIDDELRRELKALGYLD